MAPTILLQLAAPNQTALNFACSAVSDSIYRLMQIISPKYKFDYQRLGSYREILQMVVKFFNALKHKSKVEESQLIVSNNLYSKVFFPPPRAARPSKGSGLLTLHPHTTNISELSLHQEKPPNLDSSHFAGALWFDNPN